MAEILRNKNLATKFQILAEIANSGLHIQQSDIARRLEVTPQAISDYIGQLVKDGMLSLEGHSRYRVTNEGVNWIIKSLKELKDYTDYTAEAITNISISAALADSSLTKGQKVGLEMKDGILVATDRIGPGASGIAGWDVQAGGDIGIRDIDGIVELKAGKVTILKIPNIQRGGSQEVDFKQLKIFLKEKSFVGAIGIEALVALKKANAAMPYFFGVKEAGAESAQHGISPLVACVEDEISGLIKRLEEVHIIYEIIDIRKV